MYHLTQETPDDWWEVEALFDLCFAPGREALSSYRLRDGVAPIAELCMVARDADDVLAAAIRFWPVAVSDHPVLLLGPIAVHPTRQGEGLGGFLIAESQNIARQLGWDRMLLVGDAPYYERFGFRKLRGITMPPPTNPERILGHDLTEGAWDNIAGLVEQFPQGGS
ncbi:MAG: GNAT family N-acetyltransferase [Marinosulfonomonas sp.]